MIERICVIFSDFFVNFVSSCTRYVYEMAMWRICSSNTVSAVVFRGVWLIMNDFNFQKQVWTDVKMVLRRIMALSMEWKPIYSGGPRLEARRRLKAQRSYSVSP
jgi:hypothetical protein